MYAKYLLLFIGLAHAGIVRSQQPTGGVSMRGKFGNEISVTDANGKPFENRYADVTGSPYFDADWKISTIIITTGKKFTDIKTKINLANSETVFITANGIEAAMPPGMVKEISYSDTTTRAGIVLYKFQTGFPPVDKQTTNNFYQLLAEGRCSFLKSVTKTISEKKNELSGEITKEFETYEDYYLLLNGEMKRMKKDKDFIMQALSDKQPAISQYMQTTKINYKTTSDLIKLFTFYNTL